VKRLDYQLELRPAGGKQRKLGPRQGGKREWRGILKEINQDKERFAYRENERRDW
jgi:hypothetical protein